MLQGKTVVLGISGGIAAYKAANLASKLTQAGAQVEVIMTEAAQKFVTPLTFRSLTGRPVVTTMWDLSSEFSVEHVSLAQSANIVVIAPATADVIARMAAGMADDSLTTTVLATTAPVVIAPSMEHNMYENPVTQENIRKLKDRGFYVIEPEHGRLASGRIGKGRLAETETILGIIGQVLGRNEDLSGRKVVVTAGGTREAIDPVRFIGNRSSGKMGYAIAEAARDRGAEVTLISASVFLPAPSGITLRPITSAAEMDAAVNEAVADTDVLIMAAAVADYRPESASFQKIKKETSGEGLSLNLVRTVDILGSVQGSFIRIGFAAESENLLENATLKMEKKNLDLIVANDISSSDSGFEVDSNKVTILDREGNTEELPLLSKRMVAERLLDRIAALLDTQKESR